MIMPIQLNVCVMTEPNKIKNKIIQHTQKRKGGIFHPLRYISVTKQTENYITLLDDDCVG